MNAAAMRAAPPVSIESAQARAASYAAAWREDCYVYMGDGIVIYSRGPDADHPKTEPTFVAPNLVQPKAKA